MDRKPVVQFCRERLVIFEKALTLWEPSGSIELAAHLTIDSTTFGSAAASMRILLVILYTQGHAAAQAFQQRGAQ
jgi:hypothetical protein